MNKKQRHYFVYDVFSYFDQFVKNWSDKSILDWGCNHSNFLRFAKNVNVADYTGVDVDKTVIKDNKKRWASATFKHFDHFNWQYNHELSSCERWPNLKEGYYDVIVAFSVFTHTDLRDLQRHIVKFKKLINSKGRIYISFYSNDNKAAFDMVTNYRKSHQYDKSYWCEIMNADFSYIYSRAGRSHLIKESDHAPKVACDSFFTFYSPNFLQENFGGKVHQVRDNNDLLNNQMCLEL